MDEGALHGVEEVLVLHKGQAMPYGLYRTFRASSSSGRGAQHSSRGAQSSSGGASSSAEDEALKLYAQLTGRVCAKRMLLYRD